MPAFNSTLPEIELIRAVRRSDAAAFKELYRRYHEKLFRFLWRRTRNGDVAEDLVQSLFVKIWLNRTDLDPGLQFKAYLYRTANNLAIDHLRKKIVRQEYARQQAAPVFAEFGESFELKDETERALNSLTEEQRQVFIFNRFEGLKYVEIAEILGISVKTVEKRMSKALKTLRSQLEHLLLLILIVGIMERVGFLGYWP